MNDIVVAFDLDDTLVAEALFIKSGIYHIARRLSGKLPAISPLRIAGCMETALLNYTNHYSALEHFLEQERLSCMIDMKEVVAEFRNHRPDPEIYHLPPSIEDILLSLKDKGYPLALITDGRSTTQRNKIEAAGLYRFFNDSDIFISEETGHDKMSPDNFLAVMRKYAGATEFHYVGDNPPKDFLHPSRLGWATHMVHPFPLAIHQGMPR